MYKPILESVDIKGLMAVSDVLVKPLANISALQYPTALQESLSNFANVVRAASGIDYESLMETSKTIQAMFEGIQPSIELMKLNIPPMFQEYSDMVSRLNQAGYRFSDLVQQAYDSIEDEEEIEDDFESNEELVESLEEHIDNPIGFQERYSNWSEKKKKKYYIVYRIICLFLTLFIVPYFQDTIGKPVTAYTVSKVKELPEKAGKVIDELRAKRTGLTSPCEIVAYAEKLSSAYNGNENNLWERAYLSLLYSCNACTRA